MREIKFRGKRIDNGEWAYGWFIESYDKAPCIQFKYVLGYPAYYKVIPESIGQYTGKNDKDGVEIYEGDIITMPHVDDEGTGPVEWESGQMRWSYRKHNGMWGFQYAYGVEVIGNIHDNPELLK